MRPSPDCSLRGRRCILPGIVILTEVMDLFALESVEISEHDILQGAMLAAAEGGLGG